MFELLKNVTRGVGTAAGGIVGVAIGSPIAMVESAVNGGQETKVAEAIFNSSVALGDFVGEVAGEVVAAVPSVIVQEVIHDYCTNE